MDQDMMQSVEMASNEAIVFTIECKDGKATYRHVPGRCSWRYLDNIVSSGGVECTSQQIDLSQYLTCRAVRLLERIFTSNHPIHVLSTSTGYSGNMYEVQSDVRMCLRLNVQDLDAIIDCLASCAILDMRYRDFVDINRESVASIESLAEQSKYDKQRVNDTLASFTPVTSQDGHFRGSTVLPGPQGTQGHPGFGYGQPLSQISNVNVEQYANDGELWTRLWSYTVDQKKFEKLYWYVETMLRVVVVNPKDATTKTDDIIPLMIFASIIYSQSGHKYWPVDQVLRAASCPETVDAIADYLPHWFGMRKPSQIADHSFFCRLVTHKNAGHFDDLYFFCTFISNSIIAIGDKYKFPFSPTKHSDLNW